MLKVWSVSLLSAILLAVICSSTEGRSIDLYRLLRELEDELEAELSLARRHLTEYSDDPGETVLYKNDLQKRPLRVAAFNIQIFGDNKYSKKNVVNILLQVGIPYLLSGMLNQSISINHE